MTLKELIDEELDLSNFQKQFNQMMLNINNFSNQAKNVYNDPNIIKNFETLKNSGMLVSKSLADAQAKQQQSQQQQQMQNQEDLSNKVNDMATTQSQQQNQTAAIQKSIETLKNGKDSDLTKQIAATVEKTVNAALKQKKTK